MAGRGGGCVEEKEQQVALEQGCWDKKRCFLSWKIVDPIEERLII